MTRKIALPLIILTFLSFNSDPDVQAEVDGFKGLKWGAKFSTVKEEMNYTRTDPSYGEKIYARKNEELKVYGVEVQSISYGFWMDELSSIMIRFNDNSNFISLKESIFKRFGKGHKAQRFIKGYVWGGEVTAMALEYNKVLNEGYLFLYSVTIQKKQQSVRREKE